MRSCNLYALEGDNSIKLSISYQIKQMAMVGAVTDSVLPTPSSKTLFIRQSYSLPLSINKFLPPLNTNHVVSKLFQIMPKKFNYNYY